MPTKTLNRAEPPAGAEPEPAGGCAFVLDGSDRGTLGRTWCGGPRRPGSAYCQAHHALCHLPSGSPAERRKMREIEALAEAVGGRSGRPARRPPPRFLQRLERVSRAASAPELFMNCSDDEDKIAVIAEISMRRRTIAEAEALRPDGNRPTAERLRHGPIERLDRAIADTPAMPRVRIVRSTRSPSCSGAAR